MKKYEDLSVVLDGHIATITIQRPPNNFFDYLLIQQIADVLEDLGRFFNRLVPDGDPLFDHQAEGPDDMPAHIRSALTQTQLSIPIRNNEMALGIWQGIYLFEHRVHPHTRNVLLHLLGE